MGYASSRERRARSAPLQCHTQVVCCEVHLRLCPALARLGVRQAADEFEHDGGIEGLLLLVLAL